MAVIPPTDRVPTGCPGLDDVLGGGLPGSRFYLVQGDPGVGKTTLALHFLLDGARKKEPAVYVTLSETEAELRGVASSHGWSLDGISIHEMTPDSEEGLRSEEQTTLFHPAEVELGETTANILALVEKVKPTRVVLDSLSEMRLLAQNPLRYRRQILTLKQFFTKSRATVLLLDDRTSTRGDPQLESIVHGVIDMEQLAPEYGAERRRLRVAKLRGARFRGGYHDFTIRTGALEVFPRLVAAEHLQVHEIAPISSGIPAFDELLGGGMEPGTCTLLIGPAGSGKSTLAAQYAKAWAERGERAKLFAFDERRQTLLMRARQLHLDLDQHVESGRIAIQQVDPAELSPGEFISRIRRSVEEEGVGLIIIDSLNGFMKAMLDESFLQTRLHELLNYLGQRGVITVITVAQHGIIGPDIKTAADVSYLADTVVLFRFFELDGEIRKALSVLKRRTGQHETTIRELRASSAGLSVGPPLRNFRGIMTGVPSPTQTAR